MQFFLTFRSCRQLDGRHAPCRPVGGRQTPIIENFSYSAYIFEILFFLNIKMKKARETRGAQLAVTSADN